MWKTVPQLEKQCMERGMQRVESAMFEVQMVKVWNQLTHSQSHTSTALSTLTTLGSEHEQEVETCSLGSRQLAFMYIRAQFSDISIQEQWDERADKFCDAGSIF